MVWRESREDAAPLRLIPEACDNSKDMKIDVVADKFNDLEKGLFAKLLDRSVLPLAGTFEAFQ